MPTCICNDRFWPFSEAQATGFSVSFEESCRSDSMHQRCSLAASDCISLLCGNCISHKHEDELAIGPNLQASVFLYHALIIRAADDFSLVEDPHLNE